MKKIVLATATLLFCFQSWAQDSLSTRIHNHYQSLRAMGMGNAFSPMADDYAAMYYNPSMLAFRKNSEFQINLVTAGFSTESLKLSKDIQDATDANKDGTDTQKADAISAVLDKYYGKPIGVRLSPMEFTWVSPRWGISLVMADITADITVNRQIGPAMDIYLIKDTTLAYAYAWNLGEEAALGFTAKFNHRNEFAGQYAAMDLALDSKIIDFKRSKEGTNLDFDIGYTWKPLFEKREKKEKVEKIEKIEEEKTDKPKAKTPEPEKDRQIAQEENKTDETDIAPATEEEKPAEAVVSEEKPADEKKEIDTKTDGIQINTKKVDENEEVVASSQPLTLSAVMRNVLSMSYTKSAMVNKDATDKPVNNNRVLDLGVSYAVFDYAYTQLKLTAEAKNLMHPEASFNKCSHFGLEYTLGMDWLKLQLRAGMNQLYFTAGAGLNLGFLDIEVATYGEEFGTEAAKAENRVTAATVAFKF